MADISKALYDFKKKIETLKKFRGRGTELVTVYITPGYPIHETAAKLRDEYGQAANIKSKTTQKNVQGALERILNELKMYKKTPENGMALFCGNISEVEGRTDIQLFVLEPPMPLNTQFYRCESAFVIEPLEELADSTDTYGLVVMDGKEATVALLQGKKIKVIKQLHSTAHQKVSKGGQCVHESTQIEMAETGQKPIKNAFEREIISSSDEDHAEVKVGLIENVFRKKVHEAVEIKTSSAQITLSSEHGIFVDGKELPAGSVKPGMKVVLSPKYLGLATNQLIHEKVTQVKRIENPDDYFMDIEVSPVAAYFANGILVHNSAARYSRLHTEAVEYYYTRIGEAMNAFVGVKNFKGVIVGGPGPAKHDFVKQSPQNYQLKILGVVDTGYTDEYGIRETLEKSDEIIAGQEAVVEKKLMDRFMQEVSTGGLAAYGLTDIQAKLASRQISQLLVTEGLELKKFTVQCGACKKEKIVYGETYNPQDCACGGKFEIKGGPGSKEGEEDVMADLLATAEQQNVPVEYISKDTAEGAQFYATFKGLGAFLRYK